MIGVRGFFHIVRSQKHGHIAVCAQLVDYLPNGVARLRIKPRSRLVEYKYLRRVNERARNIAASALSAGQFAYGALFKLFEPEHSVEFFVSLFERSAVYAVKRRTASEIILDAEHFVEPRILKHYSYIALDFVKRYVYVLAVHFDFPAVTIQPAANNGYGSGLACAVHAQKSEKLAAFDRKRDVVHGCQIAETFDEVFYLNNTVRHVLTAER